MPKPERCRRIGVAPVYVPTLQFTPDGGGNSALLLTNFPEGGSSGIQVRITFTGLSRAFGFDSWSGNDSEGAVLDVFSGATLLGSQALTGGNGRLTATNTTMSTFDSAASDPQRFYRVVLLP